jgi:hypothetical protein
MVAVLATAASPATAPTQSTARDPHREVMARYEAGLKRYEEMAGLVEYSLDQIAGTVARIVEARQIGEIAASLERGRAVEVYLLYRRLRMADGRTRDVLQEVSPHPFPRFLREAETTFVVGRKYVIGNGAYLAFGLPAYPGAQDLVPYGSGQTSVRAGPDDLETGRQYAQWNLYKLTLQLWKERRFEKPPVLAARVRDPSNGHVEDLYAPYGATVETVRETLLRLEAQLDEIERGIEGLGQDYQIHVSGSAARTNTLLWQGELQKLRERLRLVRNYLDTAAYMGVASAPARDGAGFHRILQVLSVQLQARAVAHEDLLARAREAQIRIAIEEAMHAEAKRRAAWNYLKTVVGAACAGPEELSRLYLRGQIIGVELSHTDFMSYFVQDTTRHVGIRDILRGEYQMGPSACQRALLKVMIDEGRPISIPVLLERAEAYRNEHPTLTARVGKGLAEMGKALNNFFRKFASEPSSSSDGQGSSSAPSERSAGTRSDIGRNISVRRPDFDLGPGSTLGR